MLGSPWTQIGTAAAGGYNIVGPGGPVPYAPGTATPIPTRVYVTPNQAAPGAGTVVQGAFTTLGSDIETGLSDVVQAVEAPLSSAANFITTALVLIAAIIIVPRVLSTKK
jgi:hypothetical protein